MQAADLPMISSYLFDLALANEQLSDTTALSVTAQTIARCNEILVPSTHAQAIIARIAPELEMSPSARPEHVAAALAQLILEKPTPLQTLYTLTQLVHASINTQPHSLLEDNANEVIIEVYKALEPFLKQQKKRRFIFWLWFGCSVGIGLGTIALLHKLYTQHQHTQEALKQTQAVLVTQAAQIEALANIKQPVFEPTYHQVKDSSNQRKTAKALAKLARDIEQLRDKLAKNSSRFRKKLDEIRDDLDQANIDTHDLIANIQANSVKGIKIIKKKLQTQQEALDEGLRAMQLLVRTELGAASEDSQAESEEQAAISFKDLSAWISAADKSVDLLKSATHRARAAPILRRSKV